MGSARHRRSGATRPVAAGSRSGALARGLPAGFAGLQRAAGNRAVGQLLRAPSIRVREGSKLSAAEFAAVIGGNKNVPAWLRAFFRAEGAGGELERSPLTTEILAFVAANETAKAPPGRGLRRSSQGRQGERGHQGCAERSAALGSEGSSRTTGVLNACEREEGVRRVVLAWKLMVVVPFGDFRH